MPLCVGETLKWRMKEKCLDCPFSNSGEGLRLRRSLRVGRWTQILDGLRRDGHFFCHKTTKESGDGSELICAGSIEWQEQHGCSSQLVRIMERLTWFRKRNSAAQ